MYSTSSMGYTTSMIRTFLESKNHSYVIAHIAVIYQSVLTFLIVCCLLVALATHTSLTEELFWLVVADSVFVVLHLTYRALYRGPKVLLGVTEKKLLIVHIITSLCALAATGYLVTIKLNVNISILLIVLAVWGVSLVSGIAFYKRKYEK